MATHPICLSHGADVPDAGTLCLARTHGPAGRTRHGGHHPAAAKKPHVGSKPHAGPPPTPATIRTWGVDRQADFQTGFKRVADDADMTAALVAEAAKSGQPAITAGLLTQFVVVESNGRRDPPATAGHYGPMQIGEAATKQVGGNWETVKSAAGWKANLAAGRAYAEHNAGVLTSNGVPVTALNLYLMHQQGTAGGLRTIRAGTAAPAAAAVSHASLAQNVTRAVLNRIQVGDHRITAADLYAYWQGVFDVTGPLASPPVPAK